MAAGDTGVFDVNKVENLVFGGGGAKGVAYGGVIGVLEEVEILANVKRFAGTSVGAIVAALLAMKCPVSHVGKYLKINFDYLLRDCCCGLYSCNEDCCCTSASCCSCCRGCMGHISSCFLTCCGLCNLLCGFCSGYDSSIGMHTGITFETWLGETFEGLGFPRTVTFKELYETNSKELCIVVTNISTQMEEYCHVKTTPDLEIRQAVRMSMSMLVVFEDVRFINSTGRKGVYVDGGVLCNYPIFCFDGWWLSMNPEHSFLRKLTDVEKMHQIYNSRFQLEDRDVFKTLGFVLFGDKESKLFRRQFRGKVGVNKFMPTITEQPSATVVPEEEEVDELFRTMETKLKKKFLSLHKADINTKDKDLAIFLQFVQTKDEEGKLEVSDFIDELEQFKETKRDVYVALFGDRSPSLVWMYLTQRTSGKLEYSDISRFITTATGYSIDQWYSGFSYNPCGSGTEFLGSLTSTMVTNSSRIHVTEKDIPRTVGINTKYITALDFDMEEDDKTLLIQCGRNAVIEFLKTYDYLFPAETG
ncbi:uncharacterized protein LOC125668601 [Ostrea edulis]|uniref:uncharacterized protein LOC125668601 n=1 Tax=Ostrea edulis TaxID=37623 RepID=UPI0024AEC188|nr:uncharacterized protein LOC125668601 [Ostrea edulis]XP_056017153.1 uncharacterized protein LOC125668601 [Ostrea edulis]XP_056017154.1 uncharacterized protein LOC125668601 [Ostrea edulis]